MIAAARIGLRYFMLHPVQRWLVPIGALCCGLGVVNYMVDRPGGAMFAVGLVFVHVPATLVAGVALRHLSACRAHALAPHFRVRMLASMLVAVAAIALMWHLSAPIWLSRATLSSAPQGAILLVSFWAATLFLLAGVIASWSQAANLGVFAAAGALLVWLVAGAVSQMRDAGIDPLLLAGVTSLIGWASLGTWYLSARRIGRGAWRRLRGPSELFGSSDRAPTVSSAEASYLTGLPAATATLWFQDARWTAVYLPLALAAGWLIPQLLPDRYSDRDSHSVPLLIAITSGTLVLQLGIQAAHEARRARLLWLTRASRQDIFQSCERRALRAAAVVSAFLLAFFGPWLLQVSGWSTVAWAAVLLPAAASAGGYLGLMAVKGWRLLDITLGCALAISVYGLIPFVLGAIDRPGRAPSIVLAIVLALAFTCRTVARRRWRRIDWLGLRPLRWLVGYASAGSDR